MDYYGSDAEAIPSKIQGLRYEVKKDFKVCETPKVFENNTFLFQEKCQISP